MIELVLSLLIVAAFVVGQVTALRPSSAKIQALKTTLRSVEGDVGNLQASVTALRALVGELSEQLEAARA